MQHFPTDVVIAGSAAVGRRSLGPSTFSIGGSAVIGASYAALPAPRNGLLVEGLVGIGVHAPSRALHVVTNDLYPSSSRTALRVGHRLAHDAPKIGFGVAIEFELPGVEVPAPVALVRALWQDIEHGDASFDVQVLRLGILDTRLVVGGLLPFGAEHALLLLVKDESVRVAWDEAGDEFAPLEPGTLVESLASYADKPLVRQHGPHTYLNRSEVMRSLVEAFADLRQRVSLLEGAAPSVRLEGSAEEAH